jgi:hypothetical protein
LYSFCQACIVDLASVKSVNQCTFKHSSRKLPLNDSIKALSVGFPGRENSRITLFVYAHRSNILPENSLPLSQYIRFGDPRSVTMFLNTRRTSSLRNCCPGSTARHSRVKISIMVNALKRLPLLNWSLTKSILQAALGAAGRVWGGSRLAALTCRLGRFARNYKPSRQYSRCTRFLFTRIPSRLSST